MTSKIALFGTTLLFLDVLGIILCYEFVSRFVSSLFWRCFFSLLVIVAFDNFFFTLFIAFDQPDLLHMMKVGFAGKATAALFYTAAATHLPPVRRAADGRVGHGRRRRRVSGAHLPAEVRAGARADGSRRADGPLQSRLLRRDAARKTLAHAHRYGEPLSLLIIDTDNFKSINDQFSHMEGDRVLRLIADTLTAHARSADVPCRYGGDEFVILLRADTNDALAFAERFRVGAPGTLPERGAAVALWDT